MKEQMLIGCIQNMKAVGLIRTRFFYLAADEKVQVRDVTKELCDVISIRNELAMKLKERTGKHCMVIPYEFKKGMAEYPHGCGLSHYLHQENLKDINTIAMNTMSFPLDECRLIMLTPNDLSSLYGVADVFQEDIGEVLKKAYLM